MTEDNDKLRQAYYGELARIGQAVANPNRLMLLDHLSRDQETVEGLAKLTGLTVANASQHLQRLKEARLVESEKNGLQVFYRLADPAVTHFYESLRTIAEKRLLALRSIIQQFRSRPDTLEGVELEEGK